MALALSALAACGGGGSSQADPPAPPTTPPAPTSITLQSEAGDPIGAGKTYSYNKANAQITVNAGTAGVTVYIIGDKFWSAGFSMPTSATALRKGSYPNLQYKPLSKGNDFTNGSMNVSSGVVCNSLTGSFSITDVTYVDGVLTGLDLSFEQRCDGMAGLLRGQIHWTAKDGMASTGI